MTLENIENENKTLKKKIKNLTRTKLKLKNNLNNIISHLKKKIELFEINSNWETLDCDNS